MHLIHGQRRRCGATMGSEAKTASNLNNASNICTMHQISNMHHYLQVEELREVGDHKAVEAEELESSSNVGSFVS
jgi:hypothetical protein